MSQNQNRASSGSDKHVPVGEMMGANAPFRGVVRPDSSRNISHGTIGADAIINKPVIHEPSPVQSTNQNGIGTSAIAAKPVKPIENPNDK